jgi:hypothetical protein
LPYLKKWDLQRRWHHLCYESPDIASVPVTPAGKTAEWTTEVAAPDDASGLYVLLSVESKEQRLFVNYAIDITDK